MLNKNTIKWENVNCNLCGGKNLIKFLDNVRYFENDIDFSLIKCKKCRLVFLNPRPTKEDIGKFYKSESYWGLDLKNKINKKSPSRERNKIYKPIYELIKDTNKKRILDIGAGIGLFLSEYKKRGWDIEGIEYSLDAVNFAKRNYGINLKPGDFLDIKSGENKYDYVVINNVLEHLHKPLETLMKANQILYENGKLIIAVPNIDSLGFKIFNKNWYPLQPPIHLYYFSPETIGKMLKKAGFRLEKISHSYPVHSYFSFFESYRSLLTGRNKKKQLTVGDINSPKANKKKISLIRELVVLNGKIFAYTFSIIGSKIKRGENIIIYAKKS